jgi:hypothetical protein
MISIEPLEQTLTGPGARELELNDRALEEILTLAGQNKFVQAAERTQQLWQQRIYDVRTLGCYLFGVFVERGIASLAVIFECIQRALRENLQYLSPAAKRERHLDVALRWLYDSIVTKVRFHERQKDEIWKKWNDDWLQPAQQRAIERCEALLTVLDEVLPGGRSRQSLMHVQALVQSLARASAISSGWDMKSATQIPAPPPPPESDSETEKEEDGGDDDDDDSSTSQSDDDEGDDTDKDDDDDDDKDTDTDTDTDKDDDDKDDEEDTDKEDDEDAEEDRDDDDKKEDGDGGGDSKDSAPSSQSKDEESASSTPAPSAGSPSSDSPVPSAASVPPSARAIDPRIGAGAGAAPLSINPSPALQQLLQELAGFVQLVERARYKRAAILLGNIRQTMQSFEPTRFLPALFSDYLSALARHAPKLKPLLGGEDDLETEALRQLCRADLERFLAESER